MHGAAHELVVVEILLDLSLPPAPLLASPRWGDRRPSSFLPPRLPPPLLAMFALRLLWSTFALADLALSSASFLRFLRVGER